MSFLLHAASWRGRILAPLSRSLVGSLALVLFAPCAVFAQASGVANVTFQWTDRQGAVHDLVRDFVAGYEDDSPFAPENAGSGYTSLSGVFPFIGSDLGIGQSQTEFFGDAYASIGSIGEWARVRGSGGGTYSIGWPGVSTFNVSDPPGSASFNVTVDDTTAAGTAMGMLQYLGFMRNYYVNTLGATVPYVPLDWHSGTTAGSFYCSAAIVPSPGCAEVRIEVDAQDWASTDVLMHEFGHHIAANNSMLAAGAGGAHSYGVDNIGSLNGGQNHGANTGSRLAWNEGTATFLGMMAIHEGGLGTAISGLPGRDLDLIYDDFNTPFNASTQTDADPGGNISISVGIENKTPTVGAGPTGRGEGDEMSVMRAMWDFSDSANETYGGIRKDSVNYSSQEMFDTMKNKISFRDFWRALSADSVADPSNITLGGPAEEGLILATLGMVLEDYRISGSPHDRTDTQDTTPRLVFDEQNNDNSTRYAFAVYSDDWQTLVDSSIFSNTNGTEGSYFWDVSSALTVGNTYHWAVLSNAALDAGVTPASLSDWYWSSYDSFTILPEPATGLVLALGLGLLLGLEKRPRRASSKA